MSGPGGAFTPDSNDTDAVIVQCAFPKCTAEPTAKSPLCAAHMMDMTSRSPASKSVLGREASFQTTRARLLPENEHNPALPIMRRKTAASALSSKPHPLPNSDGSAEQKPSISPTLHKAPSQRQNIHSPPDSPKREAGPLRKKMKLAHSLDDPADPQSKRHSQTMTGEATSEDKSNQSRDRNGHSPSRSGSTSRYGQTIDISGKDGTKKLSRPRVIRKTAARPLVFTIEQAEPTRPKIEQLPERTNLTRRSDSDTPEVNGVGMAELKASPRSDQRETNDLSWNNGLRAWYTKFHSTGPAPQTNPGRDGAPDAPASKPINGHLKHGEAAKVHERIPKLANTLLGDSRESRESRELLIKLPEASKPTLRIPEASKPATIFSAAASKPAKQGGGEKPKPLRKMEDPPQVRQAPSKVVDEASFDSLVYSQADASAPPLGVQLRKPAAPAKSQPRDEPYYAHIDPRLHWPHNHSEEWRKAKQKDIEARGGRKANFGRAALRMREQRLREGPANLVDQLPDRIREDPAWVRALVALEETEKKTDAQRTINERTTATRQGLKRYPSTNGAGATRK